MDFLPRYFTSCALVGALCLAFSAPSFAALDDPNYSWRLSSSGDVYRVYDPEGARSSSSFGSSPSSTFAEGDSGGAIQSFAPQPLLIDGATGDVISGLQRSLSVGDLVDGFDKIVSLDNPIGLTFFAVSTLGPLALKIYDDYEDQTSANAFNCGGPGGDSLSAACTAAGLVPSGSGCAFMCLNSIGTESYPCSEPSSFNCSSSDSSTTIWSPSIPTPPSNLANWIDSNWSSDNLANDATSALQNNPSYGPQFASQLAKDNASLSSPVPYVYSPTSNTLAESPTTTTSTDPSTGDSITTTTTPSFKVSPGTDGGLSVTQNDTTVTSSCTSAGSCTVTNTSSSSQTPKTSSPFVAPTISIPSAPTSSVKSFALSLAVPAQSVAVCPQPISFTALSNTFTIPLTPLCNLATNVNPYVESLGAVGAGIVIFR